jgi:hypothetical protein
LRSLLLSVARSLPPLGYVDQFASDSRAGAKVARLLDISHSLDQPPETHPTKNAIKLYRAKTPGWKEVTDAQFVYQFVESRPVVPPIPSANLLWQAESGYNLVFMLFVGGLPRFHYNL